MRELMLKLIYDLAAGAVLMVCVPVLDLPWTPGYLQAVLVVALIQMAVADPSRVYRL